MIVMFNVTFIANPGGTPLWPAVEIRACASTPPLSTNSRAQW